VGDGEDVGDDEGALDTMAEQPATEQPTATNQKRAIRRWPKKKKKKQKKKPASSQPFDLDSRL
jgi:hypothetical protein